MGTIRNIKAKLKGLWGIAAGRYEFEGCNKPVYYHDFTNLISWSE